MNAVAASWVGQVLADRYRVLSKLGEGGMAFVYRARDLRLDADVVVKAPRPAMLEDPEFADRFTREIRTLVRLAHPHVVRITDVGDYQGVPFAVMDYLAGGSLVERRLPGPSGKPAPAPPASLRGWLTDAAAALDFIHGNRYIHRDVKPDNILFDAHDRVYLSDFGIAKAMEGADVKARQTMLTGAGLVLGTPQYMAPELIMGKAYDGRADQYALAVTVYELLAGAPPFEGATPAAVLMDRMRWPAPPLQAAVPVLPKALSAAVAKALSRNPRKRFPDCAAFAAAVLQALTPILPRAAQREIASPDVSLVGVPVATAAAACPGCGKLFGVPGVALGRRVRCPACQTVFRAPAPAPAVSAAATPAPAVPASTQVRVDTMRTTPSRRRSCGPRALVAATLLFAVCLILGLLAYMRPGYSPPASALPRAGEGPAKEITDSIGMKLVLIPAGRFTMGSGKDELGRHEDEGPQHEVEITRMFYLGAGPVTKGQFAAFVKDAAYRTEAETNGKGGSGYNGATRTLEGPKSDYTWRTTGWAQTADHPVVNLTWNDAVQFCEWLSKKEGKTYELPTEAEWEYACRAGTTMRFWFGDKDGDLKGNANIADASLKAQMDAQYSLNWIFQTWDDGFPFTSPVGNYPANPWGLCDMLGNVREWCGDGYAAYKEESVKDPKIRSGDAGRVIRGGSWYNNPQYCRSATRAKEAPESCFCTVGFRVVLRPETKTK